jgi:hypothetical protein
MLILALLLMRLLLGCLAGLRLRVLLGCCVRLRLSVLLFGSGTRLSLLADLRSLLLTLRRALLGWTRLLLALRLHLLVLRRRLGLRLRLRRRGGAIGVRLALDALLIAVGRRVVLGRRIIWAHLVIWTGAVVSGLGIRGRADIVCWARVGWPICRLSCCRCVMSCNDAAAGE